AVLPHGQATRVAPGLLEVGLDVDPPANRQVGDGLLIRPLVDPVAQVDVVVAVRAVADVEDPPRVVVAGVPRLELHDVPPAVMDGDALGEVVPGAEVEGVVLVKLPPPVEARTNVAAVGVDRELGRIGAAPRPVAARGGLAPARVERTAAAVTIPGA